MKQFLGLAAVVAVLGGAPVVAQSSAWDITDKAEQGECYAGVQGRDEASGFGVMIVDMQFYVGLASSAVAIRPGSHTGVLRFDDGYSTSIPFQVDGTQALGGPLPKEAIYHVRMANEVRVSVGGASLAFSLRGSEQMLRTITNCGVRSAGLTRRADAAAGHGAPSSQRAEAPTPRGGSHGAAYGSGHGAPSYAPPPSAARPAPRHAPPTYYDTAPPPRPRYRDPDPYAEPYAPSRRRPDAYTPPPPAPPPRPMEIICFKTGETLADSGTRHCTYSCLGKPVIRSTMYGQMCPSQIVQ